jgi:hypothetical protein
MGLPIELAESTESELFEERMGEQCASRIQVKGICTGVIEDQWVKKDRVLLSCSDCWRMAKLDPHAILLAEAGWPC